MTNVILLFSGLMVGIFFYITIYYRFVIKGDIIGNKRY